MKIGKRLRNSDSYYYSTGGRNLGLDNSEQRASISEELGGHLIESGTRVLGGVYIPIEVDHPLKSVKVDFEENPQIYLSYLDAAVARASTSRGAINRYKLPEEVFNTVLRRMKPLLKKSNPDSYWRASWEESGGLGEEGLSRAMIERSREPHHLALAFGALLEILKNKGYVSGDISIETGQRTSLVDNAATEVNTWIRLTQQNGKVRIFDPGRGFSGTLVESMKMSDWNYMRDDERARYETECYRRYGKIAVGRTTEIEGLLAGGTDEPIPA